MTLFALPSAFALAQAAPAGPSSYMPLVIQFGLIIGIIYFVMFRPQQKQRQKHEALLKALKRGDEVVTAGGIVGQVIHIADSTKDGAGKGLDDRVTIKSGESRLVVERGRITRVVDPTSGNTSSAPATT